MGYCFLLCLYFFVFTAGDVLKFSKLGGGLLEISTGFLLCFPAFRMKFFWRENVCLGQNVICWLFLFDAGFAFPIFVKVYTVFGQVLHYSSSRFFAHFGKVLILFFCLLLQGNLEIDSNIGLFRTTAQQGWFLSALGRF